MLIFAFPTIKSLRASCDLATFWISIHRRDLIALVVIVIVPRVPRSETDPDSAHIAGAGLALFSEQLVAAVIVSYAFTSISIILIRVGVGRALSSRRILSAKS